MCSFVVSSTEEESDESDVDMDGEQEIEAQSDFSSSPSDGNVAKCDTVAMSEVAEDTDRYDENLDFEEEKEMLKKIKGLFLHLLCIKVIGHNVLVI